MALPVTFLSDFGYDDEFAGACRLVIERLAPGTAVVDITHGVPAGDVRRGALALEAAASVGPAAVHLAVVDPGVGTNRRAVAAAMRGGAFAVGPDNGLLSLALAELGGALEAVDVSATPLRLAPTAATFHGRDLFAPVAAHLAAGRPLATAGEEVDPGTLAPLPLPAPQVGETDARVHVLYADRYGNLVLDARPGELESLRPPHVEGLSIRAPAGEFAARRGATFADGGERGGLVLYADSTGRLAVAANLASAAELLGAGRDDELLLSPAP